MIQLLKNTKTFFDLGDRNMSKARNMNMDSAISIAAFVIQSLNGEEMDIS